MGTAVVSFAVTKVLLTTQGLKTSRLVYIKQHGVEMRRPQHCLPTFVSPELINAFEITCP